MLQSDPGNNGARSLSAASVSSCSGAPSSAISSVSASLDTLPSRRGDRKRAPADRGGDAGVVGAAARMRTLNSAGLSCACAAIQGPPFPGGLGAQCVCACVCVRARVRARTWIVGWLCEGLAFCTSLTSATESHPIIPDLHPSMMAAAEGDGAAAGPYQPRAILVTGGAGFIGSHTVLRLAARYPDVAVGGCCCCTWTRRCLGRRAIRCAQGSAALGCVARGKGQAAALLLHC